MRKLNSIVAALTALSAATALSAVVWATTVARATDQNGIEAVGDSENVHLFPDFEEALKAARKSGSKLPPAAELDRARDTWRDMKDEWTQIKERRDDRVVELAEAMDATGDYELMSGKSLRIDREERLHHRLYFNDGEYRHVVIDPTEDPELAELERTLEDLEEFADYLLQHTFLSR